MALYTETPVCVSHITSHNGNRLFKLLKISVFLNWWKGKPSGSKACTRKQQPRFYWSCSSVVMNDDATPLTPPSAWAELHFQMLTTYMYTPWSLRTRKIWLHNEPKPFTDFDTFEWCMITVGRFFYFNFTLFHVV